MSISHVVRLLSLSFVLLATASYADDTSRNYEKGVQAYEEGEYNAALIHAKNVLQEDPNHVSARILLAKVYFSSGNILGAEKEAGEALLLGADINLVLPIYGPSLVLLGRVDELFEIENSADSFTRESDFEWALLKGQGYMLQGDRDAARREFKRAATIFPGDERASNTLAAAYLASDMLDEARPIILEGIKAHPDSPQVWELRADLALRESGMAEALDYFLRAFKLDEENIRLQRELARIYLNLGDRTETQRYLDLILAQSPEDPAATLISAVLMIGEGNAEAGENMLADLGNTLSELDFVKSESHDDMIFIQAASEYVRGNDKSAISLLNVYLARNRSDLAAIRMLVDLYLRNGEQRRTVEFLDTHQPQIAQDIPLQMQLVHLYIQADKIYAARKLLERLKQQVPENNPHMLLLEADLLRAKGLPSEALSLLGIYDFGDQVPLNYSLMQGSLELETRRADLAVERVELLRAAYPDNLRVLNFCAVAYLAMSDDAAAQECIGSVLERSPSNIEARFSQALLLKRQGDYETAVKSLNALLEETPEHTRSILLLAQIYMLQGDYKAAIEQSNRVYAYDRNATRPGELQLEIYERTRDWENARHAATQLARAYPNNPRYVERLARVYAELGEEELARSRYQRLMELWEQQPAQLRYLASLQAQRGYVDDARRTLNTALARQPKSFESSLALAQLDLLEGEHGKAFAASRALAEEYGERAELAIIEGEVALAQGREARAQQDFMRAFETDPGNVAALRRLYELSLEGVGADELTAKIEHMLKDGSVSALAVRLLADIYLVQENFDAAARYYEQLLDIPQFENNPAILNNLANIYARTDLDKALLTARRGLESEQEQGSALLDTVGWILVQKGDYQSGLSYLRKAYARNSRDPEIRYHTAVALRGLDRLVEARKELEAALAVEGEFAGRDDARRILSALEAGTEG